MDPERWRQIEQLYYSVLEREPDERGAFLAAACGGDEELRGEVESLLARSSSPGGLFDRPAWEAAAGLLDTSAVLKPAMRLGPYQILGPLGEGGMGKVYRGLDTRLNRAVAIKISTEQFTQRFEREARAISALNHPNVCTLYDVGSLPSGSGYMVTELVEGETLRDWIKRAPAAERSLEIARQVLEALRAAHGAGIVHRDLKPANIMVRFDGYVKVLDFGLAKRTAPSRPLQAERTVTKELSLPGQITGTIAYMSPEQILGQEIDQRSDLFALGIVLFEMLTGEHPWPRRSTVDTLHAILHDDPAPIRAVSQPGFAGVVLRLLRKNPDHRYPSAEAVLEALASCTSPQAVQGDGTDNADEPARHRDPTRLIVLPFRILRGHEASDFLSVSLPDAIASSLAAIDSLVVRSTMVASRFAASTDLDVKTIAEQAQVDAILTGTILSDGEHLRVSTQLVEAADGTLLWSNTSKVCLGDIFQLQDDLVDGIVQSLALPLTDREHRALKHDVPASAIAYEFYLRGNQLAAVGGLPNMIRARDLYLRSVQADPQYAPAWACLGRTHRFIGKYGSDQSANLARADDAFQKAFALNPELAVAHNLYTFLETDLGRSLDATERLLKRAHMHRNDPNLLAGLVHACRYCGLLEASVAAHDRVRRLDPHVRTSVGYTYLQLGDFQRALDYCGPTDGYVVVPSLMALGRDQEAIANLQESRQDPGEKSYGLTVPYEPEPWAVFHRAFLEGDREKSFKALDQALERVPFHTSDPEARFRVACLIAKLNEPDRALGFLSLALDQRYCCHYALLHDPWLHSLRSLPQFTELVSRAAALDLEARTVFLDNGGDRLLGVHMERKHP